MARFEHVKSTRPCALCNGTTDCRINSAGGIHCRRTPPYSPPAGWHYARDSKIGEHIFYLDDPDAAPQRPAKRMLTNGEVIVGATATSTIVAEELAKQEQLAAFCAARRPMRDVERTKLAIDLCLPAGIFDYLGVQWMDNARGLPGWAFEERDGNGQLVGFFFRRVTKIKGYQKRSGPTRGLAIPMAFTSPDGQHRPGWYAVNPSMPVFLPEGASDTLAMMSMELPAVGRFSDQGGVKELTTLFSHPQIASDLDRMIIVVGENDAKTDGTWTGRDSAVKTAQALADALNRTIHVSMPLAAFKDVRDWVVCHKSYLLDKTTTLHEIGQELAGDLVRRAVAIHPRLSEAGVQQAQQVASCECQGSRPEPATPRDLLPGLPPRPDDWPAPWLTRQSCAAPLSPHGCESPRPVVMRHDVRHMTRLAWHDCECIDCPYCAIKKRRQYVDTVAHHLGELPPEATLYKFWVCDYEWERVYNSILRRHGLFFRLGDNTGASIVICTVAPWRVEAEQVTVPEAVQLLNASIEGLPNLRKKAFTYSRAWKLVQEDKTKRDHRWRRIGKFSTCRETVLSILAHHRIDHNVYRTVGHNGLYSGWFAIQWRDPDWVHWGDVVTDVQAGEVVSDVDLDWWESPGTPGSPHEPTNIFLRGDRLFSAGITPNSNSCSEENTRCPTA
jgi:hypothetical protein